MAIHTAKTKAYNLDLQTAEDTSGVNMDVPRKTNVYNSYLLSYNGINAHAAKQYLEKLKGKIDLNSVKEVLSIAVSEAVKNSVDHALNSHNVHIKGLRVKETNIVPDHHGVMVVSIIEESDAAYETRRSNVIKRRISMFRSKTISKEEKERIKLNKELEALEDKKAKLKEKIEKLKGTR